MFRHAARFLAFFLLASAALAQEGKKPSGSIQISFLPPPLEKATYSLGIFEAKSGKLVRHLQEVALEKDFTVGLNGLSTTWDGKDDDGKPVPPGQYAARGYAVGLLKVAGEDIQGNDWAGEDESLRFKRVEAIAILPDKAGLAVLANNAQGSLELARFSADAKLLWRKALDRPANTEKPWLNADGKDVSVFLSRPTNEKAAVAVGTYQVDGGERSKTRVVVSPELPIRLGANAQSSDPENHNHLVVYDPLVQHSLGKDGTTWTAAANWGLVQTASDGTILRKLEVTEGDPLPVAVSANTNDDRLYLLEEKSGWQRVRGLSWVETKEEGGKAVSTWQTFFERNIRTMETSSSAETTPVEATLAENPLSPGKPQKLRLTAAFDAKGSYLAAENGLRLRQISERASLQSARLTKGKTAGSLSFFQYDGAATDEFSIAGTRQIMEFDAGEVEMTASGEKPAAKAAEPPDL